MKLNTIVFHCLAITLQLATVFGDGAMGHGAEMNGCGKCLKYLMFTFNLLSLVSSMVSFWLVFITNLKQVYLGKSYQEVLSSDQS